ncbi:MAG: hypothetical protein AB8F78_12835 [Saprospiraceae bacterium]
MRVIHRYLGFFLAGIMAVYSISGMVLVFRDTDFLKTEEIFGKTIDAGVAADQLGNALGIRRLKVEKAEGDLLFFKNGSYNSATGEANWTVKELPYVLNQMTHLHKAKSADPLYFLNLFFGASLLFFVISSFWMFMPGTEIFKKGIWFSLGGAAVVLVLLFI